MKLSNNNNNNNNEGSKMSIIRVNPLLWWCGKPGIGLKNNEAALRYQAGEGVMMCGGRIDIVAEM